MRTGRRTTYQWVAMQWVSTVLGKSTEFAPDKSFFKFKSDVVDVITHPPTFKGYITCDACDLRSISRSASEYLRRSEPTGTADLGVVGRIDSFTVDSRFDSLRRDVDLRADRLHRMCGQVAVNSPNVPNYDCGEITSAAHSGDHST